jgi:uncharacterized protein with HEPN domain
VLAYTESGRDEFFVSPMIQDAVVRNLEIVGEAAKRVSPSLRERAPGVPWRGMAGMRDSSLTTTSVLISISSGTLWRLSSRQHGPGSLFYLKNSKTGMI